MYTEKVLEHFKNPHNYGRIENADGVGRVGNLLCGDIMILYIKVKKNKTGKEIIDDVKFETFGCAAAISTSSITTDLVKGKTLEDAMKIDNKAIVKSLGGLPPIKIHCSILASDALKEAIYDYYKKMGRHISEGLERVHQRIQRDLEKVKHMHEELG